MNKVEVYPTYYHYECPNGTHEFERIDACIHCFGKKEHRHDGPPASEGVEELTDSYGQLHEDDCELVTLEDGSYDGCTCDMKHLTQAITHLISQAELRAVREDRLANAKFWKHNIDRMFDKEIATYDTQLKGGKE